MTNRLLTRRMAPTRRTALAHFLGRWGGVAVAAAVLSVPGVLTGCAGMPGSEPPRVTLAGIETLPGEGLELRLLLKLRVQNPNQSAIDYQGVSVVLNVRGSTLASGVSPETGSVPAYGERVFKIPVTVSAVSAIRQAISLANTTDRTFDYELSGKLGGGLIGYPFKASGKVDWPSGVPGVP